MSYINENSFSRWIIEKLDGLTTLGLQKLSETVQDYAYWIIEKLDGLTTLGLQKLSETVQDYAYLILTSQTSTIGPIIGHGA